MSSQKGNAKARRLLQVAEEMLAMAARNLQQDGHLMPVALLLAPEGQPSALIGLEAGLESTRRKRKTYQDLSNAARLLGAEAAILLNDVWYIQRAVPNSTAADRVEAALTGLDPSEQPDRKEGIALLVIRPDGTVLATAVWGYARKGSHITMGERPGVVKLAATVAAKNWLMPAWA